MLLLNRGGLKSRFDFLKLFKMKKLDLTYIHLYMETLMYIYMCVYLLGLTSLLKIVQIILFTVQFLSRHQL